MNTAPNRFLRAGALAVLLALGLAGCSSSDYSGGGGDIDVHGSFYYGVGYAPGFYGSPWYGYPPPPVVVTPPPSRPPGGGVSGPRPTPMPSMPTARRR